MTTIYWRKYKYISYSVLYIIIARYFLFSSCILFIKPNCIYTPGAIFCIERALTKATV